MSSRRMTRATGLLFAAALMLAGPNARAMIDGIHGPAFHLTAGETRITTGDGNSLLAWGYSADGEPAVQYPGPTLIVQQGDTVTVQLDNLLAMPVSMVFPGQGQVTTTGGTPGALAQEAPAFGGSVTYSFVASRAGTYLYHSGTRPELQVEMGLVGALIVRPASAAASPRPRGSTGSHTGSHMADSGPGWAYETADTRYDRETLFLLTEMDPRIHTTVELLGVAALERTDYLTNYTPNYWFINGRTAPDTMSPAFASWLPSQPYDCMPRMHPGDRLLMRIVNGGRDVHPFHFHGNHARTVARNGRLLGTPGSVDADLSFQVFTVQSVPAQTVDAIYEWTGKGLGWDAYGHAPGDALAPNEDEQDHGKPLPVQLPADLNLTFGGYYSGSPFLGSGGSLPPGEGGLNPTGGFVHMWHSHSEREMTNYNLFPGGMMTMLVIEPPGVPIP